MPGVYVRLEKVHTRSSRRHPLSRGAFIAQEPLPVPQSSMIFEPSFVRLETCGPTPNRESSRRCRLKLPNVEGPDLSSMGRPAPFVSQPADRRIQPHSMIVSQYGLSGLLWSFWSFKYDASNARNSTKHVSSSGCHGQRPV